MTKKKSTILLLAAVASATLAGTALASPPSGILSGAILARASFTQPVDVKIKVAGDGQEVIHVPNTQETVMQHIVVAPGGNTGWHSHPGPAVALVKSGALTLYAGDDPTCAGQTYEAGEAFVDSGQGHTHVARNLSATDNLEVLVTYFDVPPGGSVRVDAEDPGTCDF